LFSEGSKVLITHGGLGGEMTMMIGYTQINSGRGKTECIAKIGRNPNWKRGFSCLQILGAYYS
jgi:hypothetical protein